MTTMTVNHSTVQGIKGEIPLKVSGSVHTHNKHDLLPGSLWGTCELNLVLPDTESPAGLQAGFWEGWQWGYPDHVVIFFRSSGCL